MEEDIKILEEFLETAKIHTSIIPDINFEPFYKEQVQAIENLLKRYKELKEENERLIIAKAEALQEMRKYKAKAKDLKEQKKGLIESNKEWLKHYSILETESEILKEENEKLKKDVLTFKDDSGDYYEMTIEEIKSLHDKCCELEETSEYRAKFIEKIEANMGHKGMTKTELAFVCASLEEDNKELEEELKNSIPISVIQNKIDELKNGVINLDTYPNFSEQEVHREIVDVLQALLEERE